MSVQLSVYVFKLYKWLLTAASLKKLMCNSKCYTCKWNRDLKCNRICKLPVSSSCLGTFYDPYFFFKLPIFTLTSE